MEYTGIIRGQQFHPMVNFVASILQLTVQVDGNGPTFTTEDKGAIGYLSHKYGFEVTGDNYDFTPVIGRECRIRTSDKQFYCEFIAYTDLQG